MTLPPETVRRLRVFLASPGDVGAERAFVRELLEAKLAKDPWNHLDVTFEVVAWDHPYGGTPGLATMTPQQAVETYTGRPGDCDIVIVVLWSRLGTHLDVAAHPRPGGGRYESGTEWEYEDAMASARKPAVLVYHKTEKVTVDPDDPGADEILRQRRLVTAFLSQFKNKDGAFTGRASGYGDLDEFKRLVESHLKQVVAARLKGHAVETAQESLDPPFGSIPLPERCIGRDDETARIAAALTAGGHVLVQGPGGIGKTTLTQQVAGQPSVVARFAERRWFAALETATDRDTFDAQLLLGLGMEPVHGFAAALNRLFAAPALVVLDNLETSMGTRRPGHRGSAARAGRRAGAGAACVLPRQ